LEVILGSDHAGFILKEKIKNFLSKKDFLIKDSGCFDENAVDYPDIACKVAQEISGKNSFGLLFCRTGIGMCIAANKIKNIRAAVCESEFCAEMARKHNDSNILCLGSGVVTFERACRIINIFLNTQLELLSDRHLKRINIIKNMESD